MKAFLNIAIILLSMCLADFIVRENNIDLHKCISIKIGIMFGIVNYIMAYYLNWDINWAFNKTVDYKFYIVTAIGIYMILAIVKVIEKTKIMSLLFGVLGKYSFEIMALHFTIFKAVDVIYVILHIETVKREDMCSFPTTIASHLGVEIYVLFGCLLPVLIGSFNIILWNQIKERGMVEY